MSALPPKADTCSAMSNVRYVPIADTGPQHFCRLLLFGLEVLFGFCRCTDCRIKLSARWSVLLN
jgi:hypothetical protein